MGRLFDKLRSDADEQAIGDAAHELITEACGNAMCRQMVLMHATNYHHQASREAGARAQALRLAAMELRAGEG